MLLRLGSVQKPRLRLGFEWLRLENFQAWAATQASGQLGLSLGSSRGSVEVDPIREDSEERVTRSREASQRQATDTGAGMENK